MLRAVQQRQSQVTTIVVIIVDEGPGESDEVPFAQDDDVFEHLSTTTTDPALSGSVLPGAAKRRANRTRSHRLDEFDDGLAR